MAPFPVLMPLHLWVRVGSWTRVLTINYAAQGAEAAGDQVLTLEVFKSAKNIKVDPDKPLQQVRFRTLEVSHSASWSLRTMSFSHLSSTYLLELSAQRLTLLTAVFISWLKMHYFWQTFRASNRAVVCIIRILFISNSIFVFGRMVVTWIDRI